MVTCKGKVFGEGEVEGKETKKKVCRKVRGQEVDSTKQRVPAYLLSPSLLLVFP